MSKHTPGPWRFGKNSDDVVADQPAGHGEEADHVAYYGGHLVAESICSRNRSLIAAAPELLSISLRFVALDSVWHPDRYEDEKRELMNDARIVIAKAQGES